MINYPFIDSESYIDETITAVGNLNRTTGPLLQDQLINTVRAYNKTESSSDLHSSVTFIKRCLQLNPVDRASSKNLLADSWFKRGNSHARH